MSEQRWTAPESGWYRWSGGGDPEFLGPDKPEGTTVQLYDEVRILMNSGGALPVASPLRPATLIRWDTEPTA